MVRWPEIRIFDLSLAGKKIYQRNYKANKTSVRPSQHM